MDGKPFSYPVNKIVFWKLSMGLWDCGYSCEDQTVLCVVYGHQILSLLIFLYGNHDL